MKAAYFTDTDRNLDAVLRSLIENMTIPVSGERLAKDLGISHSRVIRLVDRLRSEGIEILGEPFTGFRLTRLPDVLMPQSVSARLHTRDLGQNFYHLYAVDSTNAFASSLFGEEPEIPHGTTVVAERQTAGRGRRGRTWISAPGVGLYLSVVLKPEIPSSLAPLLTLGAAVAAHDAIERITELPIDIKWPNDLLVGRRKVCGILSELHAELDHIRAMVVGIGINVNNDEMPDEIQSIATSLRIESGRDQSRIELLVAFLTGFEKLCERFLAMGPATITEPWMRFSSFAMGRALTVHDGMRRIEGTTEGLNRLGALKLRQIDGSIEEVYSGDVVDWR